VRLSLVREEPLIGNRRTASPEALCWQRGGPTDSFSDSLPCSPTPGLPPYRKGVHDSLDDQSPAASTASTSSGDSRPDTATETRRPAYIGTVVAP